ncbi:glycosyltransferase [Lactobacillus sp.]|uniref:glycosyltransferase n=1 Tax=Lactobacillus sp. TaxID=1591 RepID=UPI0025DC2EB7|nr:glycosyltransferase [Lactobacillus sp.]MCO6531397.1 glycosyltransferase [Lactobacillus sp.]MCO6532929.1 glycosyltransferase [Lactobacillus sp.]
MYYFLNNRLDSNSSGIEHAEVKRLKLFKQKGVKAKLAMRDYNRFAHQNLPLYGLNDDDYVNMYDFFAGTVNYPQQKMTIDELPIPESDQIKKVDNGYEVYDGNRKTMLITLFSDNNLDSITYFNADDHKTKMDFYDTRGFKSFTQIFNTSNDNLIYESFYRPDNTVYYEVSYEQKPKWLAATNIQLTDKKGIQYSLMNIGQAFTIMLDELNEQDGGQSTFISDRSNITNLPMINMKTPARKIEHFHSIHYGDYRDPNSFLSYGSIANTEQLSKTDLIITPGQRQADDMKKRLRTQVPIVAIPVGIVSNEQLAKPHIPMSQRIPGKIVILARLFVEKRIGDSINAFAQVYQKNKNLTLDIYGYPDGSDNCKEEKKLKKLVKDLGLENCIHFMGYANQVDDIYDHAQLMLLSSLYEGASLVTMEAQSHGVPVISYDINYGPSDLINNNVSGVLVPNGNVDVFADEIAKYFSDSNLRERMSEAAYENAKRFSGDEVWKYWKKYVIDTDKA